MAVDTRIDQLRSSDLFHDLDDEALERIAADATEYSCPAETVLIEPGIPASGIFVIVEGTAAAETHDGRRHELGPGQSIGELSLLADTVRTGRVWAKTPVRALAFDRSEFERMLESEPAIARSLLRVLACRLVDAQAKR